jgi:hypothetical protein
MDEEFMEAGERSEDPPDEADGELESRRKSDINPFTPPFLAKSGQKRPKAADAKARDHPGEERRMERATGLEPATSSLGSLHSTN